MVAKIKKKIFSDQALFIFIAIVPCSIFYIFFVGIPMFYSFYLSLLDWKLAVPPKFIGFGNYLRILREDRVFYIALRNTWYYSMVTLPLGTVLALTLALLINQQKRFAGIFRTSYFVPVVTSMVACSIIWRWLYQPRFGLLNQILSLFGLPGVMWLQSPALAMPSIILMSIWKGIGFTIVIFLAGLQSVPSVFYDAAKVDGAASWQIFKNVTLPLLQPAIVFVLVTGLIGSLQTFTQMFIMTQGGPSFATTTIVYHLYLRAFQYFRLGYASAVAFLLFLMIIVFTIIQLRVLRTTWEY